MENPYLKRSSMKIKYLILPFLFLFGLSCPACSGSDADTEPEIEEGDENRAPDIRTLDYGELLAFPYAEGHGRNTTGGRGGTVYHVTTLEDNNQNGSLRYALGRSGARTIVFDVSGTIRLKSPLGTGKNDVTIAGQTSPGGICIAGYPFLISSDNVIIRFIRFRPGNIHSDSDGLGGMDRKNVIIDHCSVSWGTDECLSVYGMQNSTVQWCLAAQALRATPAKITGENFSAHGYGGNWGGHYASYHHNMIAHCESRVPRLGPRYTTLALNNNDGERVDIRNNVFYNWAGEGCYGGEAQHANIVNNYYKPGPATEQASGNRRYRIAKPDVYPANYSGAGSYGPWLQKWGKFFIDGNQIVGYPAVSANNWDTGVFAQMNSKNCATDALWNQHKQIKSDAPVVGAGKVTTHAAAVAYERVLTYVGASNYRDKIDELIVHDVRNKKASCTGDAGQWTTLRGYSQNKKGYINKPEDVCEALQVSDPYNVLKEVGEMDMIDTDGDGIPDYWEEEFGLNPRIKADGNEKTVDKNGQYTNLEMYLNSLVHDIMIAGNEGGTMIHY